MDGWIFLVSFFLFNLSLFFTSSLLLLLLNRKILIFLACVILTYTPSSRSLATRVSLPCFDFALTSSALGKSFRLFDILSVQ